MSILPPDRLRDDPGAVSAVALALAKVVAGKHVTDDPQFRRLDGLGRIMAANNMALGMAGSLTEEAKAAIEAVETFMAEGTLQ
jgi:hypothetical protein